MLCIESRFDNEGSRFICRVLTENNYIYLFSKILVYYIFFGRYLLILLFDIPEMTFIIILGYLTIFEPSLQFSHATHQSIILYSYDPIHWLLLLLLYYCHCHNNTWQTK